MNLNPWDLLILAAVAAMVVLALRAMRGKKTGCGCGCGGCAARGQCGRERGQQ